MNTVPNIRRCAHRKTNGIPCGSPALKDKPYCYFHDRWREQHIDVIDGTPYYQNVMTELPILEDANAIQMSLSKVFHMLLAGLLDPKFAKSLIYCLSIAAQNLRYCNFAPKDEQLGDNAPAREDQSIPQNMLKDAERPENSDRWQVQRDKEDADLLAKQRAEIEESKQEETVDIQAMAETELRDQWVPHVSRFSRRGKRTVGKGTTLVVPQQIVSDPRASAPEADNEITIDLMAGRRLGSEPSRRQRKPKKLRTFSNFDEYEEQPTKKPKPVINLYERMAQRREDHKKHEKVM